MVRSLWVKLALALSLVVATSVGLVAYIAHQSTWQEFESYVEGGGRQSVQRATEGLAAYYTRNGSWAGVEPLLVGLVHRSGTRMLLTDGEGAIIADTVGQLAGRSVNTLPLGNPLPITVANRQVGKLYVALPALGRARMGSDRGRGAGSSLGVGAAATPGPQPEPPSPAEPLEERFLALVDRSLWITALAALGLAVGLSTLLARQITRPLAALRQGAHRIAAGDFTGRVPVTSRDEVGDLARSFNAMAEALERNERARRQMVADIAHELKTPLTVIEGTADALLDGVFEPTPENIRVVRDQSALLSKLVDDLRELSLAEAGQLKLERAPTDVQEAVEQATHGVEAAVQERGIRLETRVSPNLPTVWVDPTRLSQVLGNLLSNALRHTPAGGTVGIEARLEEQHLLLVVSDTGEGIPAEDLPFVFDRFYRADKSRSRRSGGSGLGLAIVKQLVEAHGGQVWAESIAGAGSRFCVALPIANEPELPSSR